MQTIYLDISNKGVVSTVYAKQNDVGRKFAVILTDSGLPYIPEIGSVFSVWYKGASGEGNYTDIGNKSAFSFNGNKVEVEMIVQMLSAHGDGILCLTLNSPDGNQISSWNIPYMCEMVPGSESEKAEEYYTAFSKAVEELPYPDETLSISGKAADSAAVGKSLAKKADISYTKKICNPHNLLDNSDFRNPVNQRGFSSYTGGRAYCVDRWQMESANGASWLHNDGANKWVALYPGAFIAQPIPEKEMFLWKTMTLAFADQSGYVRCMSGKIVLVTSDGAIHSDALFEDEYFQAFIQNATGLPSLYFYIVNKSSEAMGIKWAALYEGEYTAETLPPYVPKGYVAELAECMRYYQIRSTNNVAAVDMRPPMRLTAPTISSVTDGYAYSADL